MNLLPPVLYHYTCLDHGYPGIVRDRLVKPLRHLLLGHSLVWCTDLDLPDRRALGLTGNWITCDRTVVRVDVAPGPATQRWGHWAHDRSIPRYARDLLEIDALPAHWWVSVTPLRVITIHSPQRTSSHG